MAVSVEYQAWAAGTYNWLDRTTSTAAPVQVDNKLRAWITAVNANPSNASKQITIEKGLADGTGSFVGWTIKLASPSPSSTFYLGLFTDSTTSFSYSARSGWASSTSNGGYGTFSGLTSGASASFTTGGTNGSEFIVATETLDTEEFFCLGFKSNSTSNQTGSGSFLIFKDTAGEWAAFLTMGGSVYGTFYLPVHTSPTRQYGVNYLNVNASLTNGIAEPFIMAPNAITSFPAAGNAVTGFCTPKNQYILASANTGTGFQLGRYATLPGPRTAVCVGYSPIFVSYV